MKTKKRYIAPQSKWYNYRTENGFGLSLGTDDGTHGNGQEKWDWDDGGNGLGGDGWTWD